MSQGTRAILVSCGAVLVAAYGVLFLALLVPWMDEQRRMPLSVIALHLGMFAVAASVVVTVARDIVRLPALSDTQRAVWLIMCFAALPVAVPAFYLHQSRERPADRS